MITHHFAFDPRRAYRGSGTSGGAASRFVGLANKSTAAQLLLVFDFNIAGGTAGIVGIYDNPSIIGSAGQVGLPMMQGEASGAGQVYTGTDPATPAFSYLVGIPVNQSMMWWRDMPFSVILPNQMLNISTNAIAAAINVSFLWMQIRPEELFAQPAIT